MEGINGILDDWFACHPEGVVLRACNLGQVITRVVARADALIDSEARGRVYSFLAPASNGPPLLVQNLRIDGGYRMLGSGDLVAVVHFMTFWRSLHDVCIAARSSEASERPREAIAHELAEFRDGLLASHFAGTLTVGSLIETLVDTRRQSVDQSAWAPLQAIVAKTARAAAETRSQKGQSRDVHDEHLPLDTVSMLVLPWLQDLIEDYLRGEKARRIQTVSKTLGCEATAACAHLCSHRWNVESTLRRQRAANASATPQSQGTTQSSRPRPEPRDEASKDSSSAAISIEAVGDTRQRSPGVAPVARPFGSSPWLVEPGAGAEFRSVRPMSSIGDSSAPEAELLPPSTTTEQDPLEVLKRLSATAEDVENIDGENECPICVQPYGRGNEQLMTKCCDQALCAHCAATLATNDGHLRCPFCRRIDRHPAVIEGPRSPAFDVFQAANSFARDAGRFVNDLFGVPAEQQAARPNLRFDVVFR